MQAMIFMGWWMCILNGGCMPMLNDSVCMDAMHNMRNAGAYCINATTGEVK